MADQPAEMLYLEPDDEITAVVRRIRASAAARVILVASGRSKATSSAIALRLLARVAEDEGRDVALVADPASRALAAEAGIAAFASVADAAVEGAVPTAAEVPRRASIRVMRDAVEAAPLTAAPRSTPGDETQAVTLPAAEPTLAPSRRSGGGRRAWRGSRRVMSLIAAVVVIALAGLAAVLPSASVEIAAATQAIGPRTYTIEPDVHGPDQATLQSTKSGRASGERIEQVMATGTVTFFNWNGPNTRVDVPAGTVVSGGGATFRTTEDVVVPGGHFAGGPIESGEADVAVTAVDGGTSGNVEARAIDTVETADVAAALSGPFGIMPVIGNAAPTMGGDEVRHIVIEQADVKAVVAAIQGDLRSQIAARIAANPDRVYPGTDSDVGAVDVPGDLVGTEDQETFELRGSYDFTRPYVLKDEIDVEAAKALEADAAAVPATLSLVHDSIEVSWGTAQQVGGTIRVPVTVSASATTSLDANAIRQRILGMTPSEATAEVGGLGSVTVHLWPGWVDRIPRLEWRVSVEIVSE